MFSYSYMQNKFDYEEFLAVAKKLVEEQYGNLDEDASYKSLIKKSEDGEKIERAKRSKNQISKDSVIDFTNVHSDNIGSLINKTSNGRVGDFLIRFMRYSDIVIHDFILYEEKNKMHYRVNYSKDYRFKEADCIFNFKDSKDKEQSIIDIIRFLQMVVKLDSFL